MPNQDVEVAWKYHDRTRHSPESVRRGAHYLDWDNRPRPFKDYLDLAPVPPPDARLARLLQVAAGVTRRRRDIWFRAYSCTGALYEIELYAVLPSGVYHWHPGENAFRRLREGDYRAALEKSPAGAYVVATGTYWRNAWKYRERTYRHFGWDNGTLHANLLALGGGRLRCGFVDADVNRLLDLNTEREVALTLLAVGDAVGAPPPPEMPPLGLRVAPVSARELDYPVMREIHQASSLRSEEEVTSWRAGTDAPVKAEEGIEEVIRRRGSCRRFRHDSITREQLLAMLERAARPIPADFPRLNEIYVIVHAVDGVEPGAYYWGDGLERLKPGNFRREAAFLALEQDLAGDCSAAVFFLAGLDACLERFGNRGYRAVQLDAGIRGGYVYLAAYAQQLGATGLTFYDDEVVRFFSPHAAAKAAIFLVAAGHGAR